MAVYRLNDPQTAAPLFDGWQETLIWSCLQGVMGEIYADSPEIHQNYEQILNLPGICFRAIVLCGRIVL